MDVVAICRAYVDLIVPISESELAQIGFKAGGDYSLAPAQLQPLIDRYLKQGKLLPGGPAANTIAIIAALGGKATFIGKVGNDILGQSFIMDFAQRGVTFNMATSKDSGTACCMVFVTPDGDRSFVYHPRIADQISSADIEINHNILADTKYLYIGLPYRVPKCAAAIALARQYAVNAKVATTLQSYQSGTVDLAMHILTADIIFGNAKEYAVWLQDLQIADLTTLTRQYPDKIFVCTIGQAGALIANHEMIISIPAMPVQTIHDMTGAGDALAGGFLYGLSKGLDLKQAGYWGAKSAAKIIGVTGGRLGPSERLLLDFTQ